MELKGILRRIFYSFFVIFSGAMMAMCIFMLVFGGDTLLLTDVFAMFGIAVFASLAYLVFYSPKELSRWKILLRICIHFFLIVGVVFLTAFFTGWLSWWDITQMLVLAGLILGIYIAVGIREVYQTQLLAAQFNQKLKERYKE